MQVQLQRRQFLKALAITGATGTLLATAPSTLFAADKEATSIYYSAATNADGKHFVSALDSKGDILFSRQLPARAHAITTRPHAQEIVVFARRPGNFMLVLDALTGRVKKSLENDRPLYGHGVFSKDGKLLFTTENDYINQQGIIGVRDASDPVTSYKKIAEFPSGGIGPHELQLLSDGKKLVVANGGILTHPDTGRSKLNLDTMSPALTYIDLKTEKVLDDYHLDKKYHQLSIRHLDVNQQDQVCFVMQYQGPRKHRFPLVGFHKDQAQLQLSKMPSTTLKSMKNYCGSVCADASGDTFAVSSPRGNLITFWTHSGDYINSLELTDGCGIARGNSEQQFLLSNGLGEINLVDKQQQKLAKHPQLQWDNHLTAYHFSNTITVTDTIRGNG